MPDLDYVIEKLNTAVYTLATGTGSIQERIADAYTPSLAVLSERDFPDEDLKGKWRWLEEKLEAHERPQGSSIGSVEYGMSRTSDQDAGVIAEKIVELAYLTRDFLEYAEEMQV